MRTLDVDQVLKLHGMMQAATGGAAGCRDAGALESALYHAHASFDGRDLYPTLEEKAARTAYAIIRNHPFVDGNKRMGLFAMLLLLEMNGMVLRYSGEELVALGLGLADGSIDASALHHWVVTHA